MGHWVSFAPNSFAFSSICQSYLSPLAVLNVGYWICFSVFVYLFDLRHTGRVQLWRVGSSSLTGDGTWAPVLKCGGSAPGPPGKSLDSGYFDAHIFLNSLSG